MDPMILAFGLGVGILMMATILAGSVPGVLIGAQLVEYVPAGVLRPVLGCVLLAAALGVLSKAGLDVSPIALLVLPVTFGVLAWLLARSRRPAEVAAT